MNLSNKQKKVMLEHNFDWDWLSIKGDALKRLGVIHSWGDLGFNYQELVGNAQYRFNESWHVLIIPFSLFLGI